MCIKNYFYKIKNETYTSLCKEYTKTITKCLHIY